MNNDPLAAILPMTTWILSRHKEPDEAYPTEAEADAARKAHGPGDAVVWALHDAQDVPPDAPGSPLTASEAESGNPCLGDQTRPTAPKPAFTLRRKKRT